MADYPPKKNTAFTFYVSLISQANTKIAQVNPTLATGDVKVAIDDGAPANLATLPVVDADFTKRVKVALSAGEMNGDNITIIFNDAAGAEWCDLTVNIQTVTQQLVDLASQASVNTIDDFLDTEIAAIITAITTIDDLLDTEIADIRNRLPAALIGGRMDASLGAVAAGVDLSATMKTSVKTQVTDALNVDTYTEIGSVPAATSSLVDKIRWLFALARNKITQTSTTQTLRNDADSGNIATSTDSDNGTTYSRGEWT